MPPGHLPHPPALSLERDNHPSARCVWHGGPLEWSGEKLSFSYFRVDRASFRGGPPVRWKEPGRLSQQMGVLMEINRWDGGEAARVQMPDVKTNIDPTLVVEKIKLVILNLCVWERCVSDLWLGWHLQTTLLFIRKQASMANFEGFKFVDSRNGIGRFSLLVPIGWVAMRNDLTHCL